MTDHKSAERERIVAWLIAKLPPFEAAIAGGFTDQWFDWFANLFCLAVAERGDHLKEPTSVQS